MNVQIPMSKVACIAFECLRVVCILLRIWPSLIIRLHTCAAMADAAAGEGTSTFWFRHSFVIRHSGFVI